MPPCARRPRPSRATHDRIDSRNAALSLAYASFEVPARIARSLHPRHAQRMHAFRGVGMWGAIVALVGTHFVVLS